MTSILKIDTASKQPSVVIVVLNWNGRDDTLECLRSLEAVSYANFEVIVVDNGSTDKSVEAIRLSHPNARVIENRANLGFAAGCNTGIIDALNRGADFVLLLNNDAIVASDLLDEFVKAAQKFPDAGVLGAKIYCYSDPQRIWWAGAKWERGKAQFNCLNAGSLDDGSAAGRPAETDYVCGCVMFMRSAVLRQVGLLDPRFFLIFEETDWCFRARRLGYHCLLIPQAKVWHKGSVSFGGGDSPLHLYFYTRNRLFWAERHLGLSSRLRVWFKTIEEMFGWLIAPMRGTETNWQERYWTLRAWLRNLDRGWNEPGFRVTRLAVRDYLLRRFGDCPIIVRDLNRAKH